MQAYSNPEREDDPHALPDTAAECATDDEDLVQVAVLTPYAEIDGYVANDSDLDGVFILTTADGERFKVNGWQCEIEVLDATNW